MTQATQTRSIPMEAWCDLAREGAAPPVTICLEGDSMRPLIRRGRDPVTIVPLKRKNKKGDVVDFYLTVFEERNGVWHRTDGVERERAYGLRAIENALNSVGLELCDVSAGYGFEKPGKTTERWYITAKKPL